MMVHGSVFGVSHGVREESLWRKFRCGHVRAWLFFTFNKLCMYNLRFSRLHLPCDFEGLLP
jgi:hypothetical protein